ncbi:hypothetical protein GCM10018965_084420 [Nonomuraea roseola]
MRLYRDAVTVLRAELVTSGYGQGRDWANAQTVYTALTASVQPAGARDATGRKPDEDLSRETAIHTHRVYTPGQADIRASDRVQYGGQLYEVVGSPWVWAPVTGSPAYTLALIRRVDG